MILVLKIVSGGQTGADRTALDWAIAHGVPHGGWCPKGRLAEDGAISQRYLLQETPAADSSQRTEWNARDSDGTVLLSIAPQLTGGSGLTLRLAQILGKPALHLCKSSPSLPGPALADFVRSNKIKILNVAGPKASEEPGIVMFVQEVLDAAFLSL